jgi:NAD-dependent protein deacetylase/lipoamidase
LLGTDAYVDDQGVTEVADGPSPTELSPSVRGQLERIGRQLAGSERAIAFTGAGISTESGLPDYRGSTGLWQNSRFEELAHLRTFRREPAEFWRFYAQRLATLRGATPNAAHRTLARLEAEGLLHVVITQNVDGLHRDAGSVAVIELHGSLREGECLVCRAAAARDAVEDGADSAGHERVAGEAGTAVATHRPRWPIAEVEARLAAAEDGVPRCDCGFPLKPAVVLFGEVLPPGAFQDAMVFANGADYALCLGSSLQVMPAAALPELILSNGGKVAIINQGSTGYDDDERISRVEAPLALAMPVVLEAALAARAVRTGLIASESEAS